MLIDPGFPLALSSPLREMICHACPRCMPGRGGSVREITEGQSVHWTLAHRETSRLELM